MSSRVDGRGGLYEIDWLIPFLSMVAVIGGIIAVKLKTSKRLAAVSALVGITGWCCGLVLVHFIRTSLR